MTPRLTAQERAEIGAKLRALYDDGASINMIVAETGRSYGAVHKLLTEADTVFRPRGGVTRTRKRGM